VTTKAAAKPDIEQAAVIGGAIGGGCLVLSGALLVFLLLFHKRKRAKATQTQAEVPMAVAPNTSTSQIYGDTADVRKNDNEYSSVMVPMSSSGHYDAADSTLEF
jgi:hypothetical protein